jgi:hypothetical protein
MATGVAHGILPAMSRRPDPGTPDAVTIDEALAADARTRLREEGIIAVEPDERIGVMLVGDERVIAVRRGVCIERRKDCRDPDQALRGDLYVTTRRLVCLGQVSIDLPLGDIREAGVVGGALRLIIGDGRGLEIRTTDPRLLRVQIAAVRVEARATPADECPGAAEGGAARGSDPSPP